MQWTTSDLYYSPDNFLNAFESSLELLIDKVMQEKTQEWEERNSGRVVSGSAFALCTRQAFFRYFSESEEAQAEFPLDAKKKMFLGHKNEDIIIEALRLAIKANRMPGLIETEQGKKPVNTKLTFNEVVFSSTSDIISCHIIDPGEKTEVAFEIPIELKNTESHDYIPPNKWWKDFQANPDHLRQLSQWMHYRKKEGIAVPYGVLLYTRRSNYDVKSWTIADVDEYPTLSPVLTGDNRFLVDYTSMEAIIKGRMRELAQAIDAEQPPPFRGFREKNDKDLFAETIPQYRCNTCIFKKPCQESR